MNLTDKQRDLLLRLVSNYESNGGSEFYFTRSMTNSGVSYSGAKPTSFPCQDLDLDMLRRAGFVQLVPVSKNVVRGQLTRLGIEVIGANPSPDRAQRQAEISRKFQPPKEILDQLLEAPDQHLEHAKSEAGVELKCARSQWDYMAEADRKLRTSTASETLEIEQERDRRLSNAISHLEFALSLLFDAFAKACWNLVRPDNESFSRLPPVISDEVTKLIAFPELESFVEDTLSNRRIAWNQLTKGLGIVTNAGEWAEFRRTFDELARRENQLFGSVTTDHLLGASGTYENVRIESGDWSLRGSTEQIREEFKLHATRAAITLNPPAGVEPQVFWLHRLFTHLLDIRGAQQRLRLPL